MTQFSTIQTQERKKAFWKIRDVWYLNTPKFNDADIIYYMQCSNFFGDEWYPQFTILIDLLKEKGELWKGISPSTRNEINAFEKYERFNYSFITNPDISTIENFINDFKGFSKFRNIPGVDTDRVNSYLKLNLITISKISDETDNVLVWHLYRSNKVRTCLLYSISKNYKVKTEERKLISQANRFAHWRDIKEFKKSGVEIYDFGGWYSGKEDSELLRINSFKEKFGGFITENYNCIIYPTIKGKLFFLLKNLKSKLQAMKEKMF